MVCFCRTVHAFLGFFDPDPYPDVDDVRPQNPPCRCPIIPHYGGGLLILARDPPAAPPPPHVLVSSAVRKPRPPQRVDPGSRGLRDLVYDEGLRMCTEDLGSESGNGGMDVEEMAAAEACDASRWRRSPQRRKASARPRVPPPPPLPWLAAGGHTRFMRAMRDGGRLRLTEVRIERPAETFRATREGGRLRLDLVVPSDSEEDEEREETIAVAEEEKRKGGASEEDEAAETGAPLLTAEQVVTPTRKGEDWRCQNMVSGNGVPMWWNHHPVMTT